MSSYHIASTMLRQSFENSRRTPEELSKDSRRTSVRIQHEYRINTEQHECGSYFLSRIISTLLIKKIIFCFYSVKLSLLNRKSMARKK